MSTTTSLKEKAKALSFSTVEGCRRLLAIFTALILVSSYFAYMLACDWGKIKVNDIAFDSRGAVMQATLYTPRIVHAGDNLPAILVTHGTSCSNSTVNGVAEELASRISALGVRATACASVADGVARAIEAEGPDGVACALGSLYMSGEVRECFRNGKE